MFRIRYSLMAIFGVIALAPLILFGLWSQSDRLRDEFDQVRDKHLLLARNLGAALNRYHNDLTATFDLFTSNLVAGQQLGDVDRMLESLKIHHICIAEWEGGQVVAAVSPKSAGCPSWIPAERLALFKSIATEDRISFSEVMPGPDGVNLIHLLRRKGALLAAMAIRTDYFRELGAEISFGVRGHAAIVDQKGNVLSHPLEDWVAERRNIAQVSAVRRMLNGETGIEQFYSPALKGDMIAGFTSVDGPGWGVMIPQPVQELYDRATAHHLTALTVLLITLIAVAALSIAVSLLLAKPLERLIAATESARDTGQLSESRISRSAFMPTELLQLQRGFNAMVRHTRDSNARIRTLAYTDTVTGLPNRESFQVIVSQQMEKLRKSGAGGALIVIDLDEFRAVNETLGHDCGDKVLMEIAEQLDRSIQRLRDATPIRRPGDEALLDRDDIHAPVIGRLGADEFTVFVPDPDGSLDLAWMLDRLRRDLAAPPPDFGSGWVAGASLGAAMFPRDGVSYESLVRLADIALDHAKHRGKNCFEIYRPEIGELTASEIRLDFMQALGRDELVLHYQPKVSAENGDVHGVEALIRWRHPLRGFLQPSAFVPALENFDIVAKLGEWVLAEAVRQIARWDAEGLELSVAVNIATRHFAMPNFVERIRQIIAEGGVDPGRIELEITEETVLSSPEAAQQIIQDLQKIGVHISLDDFGRGYSNLARLASLAVDTIKIDSPLVARLTQEERTRVIVRSTVQMARGLGCRTVAEGVETQEQAAILIELGCSELQGYHFAKPMEARALKAWIDGRRRSGVHALFEKLAKARAS